MKSTSIIIFYLFATFYQLIGQNKYWIFLKEKSGQPRAGSVKETTYIKKRLVPELGSDLDSPVSRVYLDRLRKLSVEPIVVSRWLNAISAVLTKEDVQLLSRLTFVKEIRPILPGMGLSTNTSGNEVVLENHAYSQLNAESLRKAGLTGKNIKIGIIDGGFLHANKNPTLIHLQTHKKICAFKDFVTPRNTNPFENTYANIDEHGNYVLQLIAGFSSQNNMVFGLAPDATFYLARTDDSKIEMRREEDFWVNALEWMDSMGVKLVNTSIGYSHDFDNPNEN